MYTHFLNCCSILHVSIVLHFRHGGLSPVQRQHYLRVARWWETPKPRKALERNHATLPEVWPQAIQCALLATELCHRGMPTKTLNIHVVNNNKKPIRFYTVSSIIVTQCSLTQHERSIQAITGIMHCLFIHPREVRCDLLVFCIEPQGNY